MSSLDIGGLFAKYNVVIPPDASTAVCRQVSAEISDLLGEALGHYSRAKKEEATASKAHRRAYETAIVDIATKKIPRPPMEILKAMAAVQAGDWADLLSEAEAVAGIYKNVVDRLKLAKETVQTIVWTLQIEAKVVNYNL